MFVPQRGVKKERKKERLRMTFSSASCGYGLAESSHYINLTFPRFDGHPKSGPHDRGNPRVHRSLEHLHSRQEAEAVRLMHEANNLSQVASDLALGRSRLVE